MPVLTNPDIAARYFHAGGPVLVLRGDQIRITNGQREIFIPISNQGVHISLAIGRGICGTLSRRLGHQSEYEMKMGESGDKIAYIDYTVGNNPHV